MSLDIAPFLPGDASPQDLRDWYEIYVAVASADFPSVPLPPYDSYVEQLGKAMSYMGLQRHWTARCNGRLVGVASAHFPTSESNQLAYISVRVSAPHRRGSVGSRLLRAMVPVIREHGCKRVSGQVSVGGDGEKWTSALGFRTVLRRSSHRLEVGSVDPAVWQLDPAPGFRLEQWESVAPQDLVHGFAQARNTMADQPTGESSYQRRVWTAERVRQHEAEMRDVGETRRYVVAVEERSGEVAGFTEIAIVPGQVSVVYQEDTGVRPQYRGLGLGRAMKAAMMRWLTADLPALEQVRTMTAAENLHMIRVNAQLGYRTEYTESSVEADVAALEVLLASSVPTRSQV